MVPPLILHLYTPARHVSPFDVNMAADAGYLLQPAYAGLALADVAALTQDAVFSRDRAGLARTAIFIGGRDALLAADMLDAARAAMFPPFEVSLMADPSGAYTTAAAMVACVAQVLAGAGSTLAGRRVLVLGGTGPVGRMAAVLATQAGAEVALGSHRGAGAAREAAEATGARFEVALSAVDTRGGAALRSALAQTELLLACGAAGVELVSAEDLAAAGQRLRVVADANAVAPAGVAGVGAKDLGRPLPGTDALAIGALAIGDVKFRTQRQLLLRMAGSAQPLVLGWAQALETAQAQLAGR